MTILPLIPIVMFLLFVPVLLEESLQEQEKMFYGKTSLKIPAFVNTTEKTRFSANLVYQSGPYSLTELNATVDVYPQSAARFVNVKIEPLSPSLSPTYSTTFHGTIIIDPEVPVDTIFLSIYYTAKDNRGTLYKSAWTDSSDPIMIKRIEPNKTVTGNHIDSDSSNTAGLAYTLKYRQYEYLIPYWISSGKLQKIVLDCSTASILMHLDAVESGNLTINIPRKMLDDEEFIVLADGEEVPIQTETNAELRTLSIPLKTNKTVEIVASHYVSQMPEYYPVCGSGDLRSPYYQLLSPMHQFKSGIPITQIQCKEGLTFLIKPNIEFGGCFVTERINEMYKRGWGTPSGSTGTFQ